MTDQILLQRKADMTDFGPDAALQIKVCGLTSLTDAQVAMEAGADLLGFIFYEKSPRYVAPEVVSEIIQRLRHASRTWHHLPRFVGVFVNWPARRVAETLDFCGLDLAQLHGEEGPEYFVGLRGRAFKALRPRSLAEVQAAAARFGGHRPSSGPDLLVDAYHPDLPGGTGRTADWSLVAHLARRYRILLAGGLTPDNVADAIRQARPWGVDVSSGVEAEPGRKDHARIRAFVATARRVAPTWRRQ